MGLLNHVAAEGYLFVAISKYLEALIHIERRLSTPTTTLAYSQSCVQTSERAFCAQALAAHRATALKNLFKAEDGRP
jgi:hypothetical protein